MAGGIPERPARAETVRRGIRAVLERGPATARTLSREVGISERDVAGHLEHLRRTLRREGRRLEVEPASCLRCGFRFEKRARITRPGRCPRCGGERISLPVFHIP